MKGRLIALSLWSAAAVLIAAGVHIASILVFPQVSSHDAFSQLATRFAPNRVELLPRPDSQPDQIPFRDPALASTICRYDLSRGTLRVGAILSDVAFLAVSFHSRHGVPFYALTNRSGNDGRIELVLMTQAQLEKARAGDTEDEGVHEIRVTAPEAEGFVEFDALPRIGGYAAARQALASVSCNLERDL